MFCPQVHGGRDYSPPIFVFHQTPFGSDALRSVWSVRALPGVQCRKEAGGSPTCEELPSPAAALGTAACGITWLPRNPAPRGIRLRALCSRARRTLSGSRLQGIDYFRPACLWCCEIFFRLESIWWKSQDLAQHREQFCAVMYQYVPLIEMTSPFGKEASIRLQI